MFQKELEKGVGSILLVGVLLLPVGHANEGKREMEPEIHSGFRTSMFSRPSDRGPESTEWIRAYDKSAFSSVRL